MNALRLALLASTLLTFAVRPVFAVSTAPIVFQRTLLVDRSTNIFTTDRFELKFLLGDSFFTPANPVSLFAGATITPADVGRSLVADASDAHFAAVVERITDSHNEFIQFLLTEQSSGRTEKRGWNERGFFTGVATSTSPDLAGRLIQSVELTIDEFTLVPPTGVAAASSLGGGPPVALSMTFTVLGIPEPGAAALLAIGLPMLRRVRYTARA